MRKMMFVVTIALLMMSALSYASVNIIGKEGSREFDSSYFPPDKKASYKIMKARCTQCHTLDRVVQSVVTGVASSSWQPFDQKAAKTYGDRIMRKANKSMTKDEVTSVVVLMQWLIAEEDKK